MYDTLSLSSTTTQSSSLSVSDSIFETKPSGNYSLYPPPTAILSPLKKIWFKSLCEHVVTNAVLQRYHWITSRMITDHPNFQTHLKHQRGYLTIEMKRIFFKTLSTICKDTSIMIKIYKETKNGGLSFFISYKEDKNYVPLVISYNSNVSSSTVDVSRIIPLFTEPPQPPPSQPLNVISSTRSSHTQSNPKENGNPHYIQEINYLT